MQESTNPYEPAVLEHDTGLTRRGSIACFASYCLCIEFLGFLIQKSFIDGTDTFEISMLPGLLLLTCVTSLLLTTVYLLAEFTVKRRTPATRLSLLLAAFTVCFTTFAWAWFTRDFKLSVAPGLVSIPLAICLAIPAERWISRLQTHALE